MSDQSGTDHGRRDDLSAGEAATPEGGESNTDLVRKEAEALESEGNREEWEEAAEPAKGPDRPGSHQH